LELGYTMNEYGLKPVETDKKSKKGEEIPIPVMNCEKDVFDFLKMKYVEPKNR